jgi:hypothetical protein
MLRNGPPNTLDAFRSPPVQCSIRRDSGNECTAGSVYSRSRMPGMAFPAAFLPRILVFSLFS